ILIMNATPQPQVIDCRLASLRDRNDVIEFEKLARAAAVAGLADERALILIPLPDRSENMRRYGALVGRCALRRSPLRRRGALPPLELADRLVQSVFQHLLPIPGGNGVAEQVLGIAQLVVHALPDRELEHEAFLGDGRQLGSRDERINMPRGMFSC